MVGRSSQGWTGISNPFCKRRILQSKILYLSVQKAKLSIKVLTWGSLVKMHPRCLLQVILGTLRPEVLPLEVKQNQEGRIWPWGGDWYRTTDFCLKQIERNRYSLANLIGSEHFIKISLISPESNGIFFALLPANQHNLYHFEWATWYYCFLKVLYTQERFYTVF